MKSFGVWLQESKRDLVVMAIKYKIAFDGSRSGDYEHNEKMGRRQAASIGVNFDQLEKDIRRTWKPGACPECNGLGYESNYKNCWFCASTGLQGMNDQQGKWWLAKQKELDALEKHHFKTYTEIYAIPKSKLAKDIVTAAQRAGVPKAADALDWGDDEEGLRAEYYQGHEQDFFIGGMRGLLRSIAQVIFKKYTGHEVGAWG